LQIANLNHVIEGKHLTVRLSVEARKWLIDKTLQERSYGARPLKRALQKYVEDELSEALIQGEIVEGSEVEVVAEGGKLGFRTVVAGDRDIELVRGA
jgi:ATP-dependent Clp protease ATP-binding subunit ClpC